MIKNFRNLSTGDIKKSIENEYKYFDIYNFKKCQIYGASKEAKLFIEECNKKNILVDGVIDDFKKGTLAEYKICKTLKIKENIPIIICTHRFGRVVEKLKKLGLKNFIPLGALHILRPKAFSPHQFYENWISEFCRNIKKYKNFEKLFKDKKSKKTLKNYMMYKYTFNAKYLNSIITVKQKIFKYANPNMNFNISNKEIFIDAGGWVGDSTEAFVKKYKKFKKIFIYEPHSKFFKIIKNKLSSDKIIVKNSGISNKNGSAYFYDTHDDSANFIKSKKYSRTCRAKIERLDNLGIKNQNITIKMNIEGSEQRALIGAKKTIMNNNTNLWICVGHTPKDLVDVLLFITSLGKNYKYFLRLNDYCIGELAIYAQRKN